MCLLKKKFNERDTHVKRSLLYVYLKRLVKDCLQTPPSRLPAILMSPSYRSIVTTHVLAFATIRFPNNQNGKKLFYTFTYIIIFF